MKQEELVDLLSKYDIPYHTWGIGTYKSLEHLLIEILEGETTLAEENGRLVRVCVGSAIDVFHDTGSILYRLIEDRQVFNDGSIRRRSLNTSIGEKMKEGESAEEAAYRAFAEELGIYERLNLLHRRIDSNETESCSFPGLISRFTHVRFTVYLPNRLFKREGYIEKQKDKTNYYIWHIQRSEIKVK